MTANAFVSGGSRGIGRAIVLKLVAKGHDCAFTFRNNSEAANETCKQARAIRKNANVRPYQLDVRDSEQAQQVVQRAIEDFGSIRIIVNNAGIVKSNAAVLTSDEDWEELIATNLSGPFYLTREFLMHLLSEKQGGRLIMISSITQDGASGQAGYAAAKAGLVGLTKSLAKEYGPKNITSNVVAPGYIETEMTESSNNPKLREHWLKNCPLRRTGSAEDVANIVTFLASEEASFINGEVIHVSGALNYVP